MMEVREHEPQPEGLHTVQQGKQDRVLGIVHWGPVHLWERPYRQTWCGRRMKGIRQRGARFPFETNPATIPGICPACSRAYRDGQPRAFGSR